MAQQLTNPTRNMRLQVRSLALLPGLRIRHCHELWCRSQTQLGSCIAVAVVQAGGYSSDLTPSLGTSICLGFGPREDKKKGEEKERVTYIRVYTVLTQRGPEIVRSHG